MMTIVLKRFLLMVLIGISISLTAFPLDTLATGLVRLKYSRALNELSIIPVYPLDNQLQPGDVIALRNSNISYMLRMGYGNFLIKSVSPLARFVTSLDPLTEGNIGSIGWYQTKTKAVAESPQFVFRPICEMATIKKEQKKVAEEKTKAKETAKQIQETKIALLKIALANDKQNYSKLLNSKGNPLPIVDAIFKPPTTAAKPKPSAKKPENCSVGYCPRSFIFRLLIPIQINTVKS